MNNDFDVIRMNSADSKCNYQAYVFWLHIITFLEKYHVGQTRQSSSPTFLYILSICPSTYLFFLFFFELQPPVSQTAKGPSLSLAQVFQLGVITGKVDFRKGASQILRIRPHSLMSTHKETHCVPNITEQPSSHCPEDVKASWKLLRPIA